MSEELEQTPQRMFRIEINTVVEEERTDPYVAVSIYQAHSIGEMLAGVWFFTPAEARLHANDLLQASEAVEVSAHIITALREQKIPEDQINEILLSLRAKRERIVARR